MTFLILLIVLVVTRNLGELVTTSLGVGGFWSSYNPQIYWVICGVMFGIYAITGSTKPSAIGVSHVMILAVLLSDYFIEAAINFARYPYQDWKVMLLSGAVFLFIPAFVCGSVSFLIVTAIKHLLSRG
jgi:hypothetical protein